jgi:hypothetical protein
LQHSDQRCEIAPAAELTPESERIARVTIEIPNDSGWIKPEMSGYPPSAGFDPRPGS